MARVTPESIAKFFQKSVVCYDFNNISSYQQILRNEDDFFSLIDREAFCALLNDCLYEDNQLSDIFKDLFDAELGIQKFAQTSARNSPRQIITYFLKQPRYSYHESSIIKVYDAINTWLVFFGAETITLEWKLCPFCQSAINDNVCTNKECKKKTTEGYKALSELTTLLTKEKSGQETTNPKYWEKIKSGSEFDLNFKREIELIRNKRKDDIEKEKLELEEKRASIVECAIEKINALLLKLEVESSRDHHDYDEILEELKNDPIIFEASQYDNQTVVDKIDELVKVVAKKKEADLQEEEKRIRTATYVNMVKHLVELQLIIEKELADHSISINDVRQTLNNADELYSKIMIEHSYGQIKATQTDLYSLEFYSKIVSPKTHACIEMLDKQVSERDEQLKAYTRDISDFDREFNQCFGAYKTYLFQVASEQDKSKTKMFNDAKQSMIDFCIKRVEMKKTHANIYKNYEDACFTIRSNTVQYIRNMHGTE